MIGQCASGCTLNMCKDREIRRAKTWLKWYKTRGRTGPPARIRPLPRTRTVAAVECIIYRIPLMRAMPPETLGSSLSSACIDYGAAEGCRTFTGCYPAAILGSDGQAARRLTAVRGGESGHAAGSGRRENGEGQGPAF